MRRLTLPALTLAFGALLSACQTTGNKETYFSAFERGSKKAETQKQESTPAETVDNYKLADLKPGERPDIESEEAGLWMMMDREEKKIARSGRLVRAPDLNRYVKSIVCKVAKEYCGDFRVYVVQAPSFNASMAPNGIMIIHSGFLLRVRNEAQLAAVIGHEIAHYLRQHSAQRLKDIRKKTGAATVVQLAALAVGAGGVGELAYLATLGSVQSFSRENEREADGYGLALMVRAGYDPNEASKIWQRVIRERDANPKYKGHDAFLSTHPQSEERDETLQVLAETVENAHELRTGEKDYQKAIAPYRDQFLSAEVAKRKGENSLALFDILLEDGYRPGEIHFYRGEYYRHRRADDDFDKAISAYRKAIAEGDAPSKLYKSLGLVLRKQKKHDEAKHAFQTYLDLEKDAPDRNLIQSMIKG